MAGTASQAKGHDFADRIGEEDEVTRSGGTRNLDWFSLFMVSFKRKCLNLEGGENSRSGVRSR